MTPIDLNTPWADVPLAVIDLETDGPKPEEAIPCELAVARFERGKLIGSWSTLLNPGRTMSAEVIAIHGISNEMVADASPAAAATMVMANQAHHLLEGAWPCGYNGMHYDRTILRRLDLSRGFEPPPMPAWLEAAWVDPLVWVRKIDGLVKGQRGRHKLGATCERWNVPHVDAHRALGDCEATGRLLWAMRAALGRCSLAELLQRQEQLRDAQEADLNRYWGRGRMHGSRDVR